MSCQTFLEAYQAELNDDDRLPYPVFFSESNCQGFRYPEAGTIPGFGVEQSRFTDPSYPTWQQVRSMYVPQDVNVRFRTAVRDDLPRNQGEFTFFGERLYPAVLGDLLLRSSTWSTIGGVPCPTANTLISACSPLKLCLNGPENPEDCGDYCWGCVNSYTCPGDGVATGNCAAATGNVITTGSVGSILFSRTRDFQETILRSCTNLEPLEVLGNVVPKYAPQSDFCDEWMEDYCLLNPTQAVCDCFVGESELAEEFPGKTTEVTCLSGRCRHSTTAYRTAEMSAQDCSLSSCETQVCALKDQLDSSGATLCGSFEIPNNLNCGPDLVGTWIALELVGIVLITTLLFLVVFNRL